MTATLVEATVTGEGVLDWESVMPIEHIRVGVDSFTPDVGIESATAPYRVIKVGWVSLGLNHWMDFVLQPFWTHPIWIDFGRFIVYVPVERRFWQMLRYKIYPGLSAHIFVEQADS